MSDNVNHPDHYQSDNNIECIQAIEAALGSTGFKSYCQGNVIKYLWRYQKKNGLEDLHKASWYLNELIKSVSQDDPTT